MKEDKVFKDGQGRYRVRLEGVEAAEHGTSPGLFAYNRALCSQGWGQEVTSDNINEFKRFMKSADSATKTGMIYKKDTKQT